MNTDKSHFKVGDKVIITGNTIIGHGFVIGAEGVILTVDDSAYIRVPHAVCGDQFVSQDEIVLAKDYKGPIISAIESVLGFKVGDCVIMGGCGGGYSHTKDGSLGIVKQLHGDTTHVEWFYTTGIVCILPAKYGVLTKYLKKVNKKEAIKNIKKDYEPLKEGDLVTIPEAGCGKVLETPFFDGMINTRVKVKSTYRNRTQTLYYDRKRLIKVDVLPLEIIEPIQNKDYPAIKVDYRVHHFLMANLEQFDNQNESKKPWCYLMGKNDKDEIVYLTKQLPQIGGCSGMISIGQEDMIKAMIDVVSHGYTPCGMAKISVSFIGAHDYTSSEMGIELHNDLIILHISSNMINPVMYKHKEHDFNRIICNYGVVRTEYKEINRRLKVSHKKRVRKVKLMPEAPPPKISITAKAELANGELRITPLDPPIREGEPIIPPPQTGMAFNNGSTINFSIDKAHSVNMGEAREKLVNGDWAEERSEDSNEKTG